jgi:hypothetical protein
MNNFTVEFFINRQWVTKNRAVFTPKFANLLDEQLDEATITLKGDSTPYYTPFRLVRITITNNPEAKVSESKSELIKNQKETSVQDHSYNNSDERITQELTLFMFVANDKAIETPVGGRRYNHELYLIELTKITERYICDTLTFTNPLGVEYKGLPSNIQMLIRQTSGSTSSNYNTYTGVNNTSPLTKGTSFFIQNPGAFAEEEQNFGALNGDTYYGPQGGVYVTGPKGDIIYSQYKDTRGVYIDGEFTGSSNWQDAVITLNETGVYKIAYYERKPIKEATGTAVGRFAVVENKLPLKKWTITDVIKRVFDLVEEVSYVSNNSVISTTPKFRLNATQATKYDQILAPEFSFTKSTLREILQQIGGFIHAEPRVESFNSTTNLITIRFDEYGSNKYSKISENPYITATFGTDINQYCTAIDSSADNLTNTLDWAQGVLIEPFNNGAKSLRTETITARLAEDDSTVIQTQFPIGRIQKIECTYIPGVTRQEEDDWDITDFIYEITDYMTLESYTAVYPYAKNFALYYTMGQKNIKGLFFKPSNSLNQYFSNYSIIEILRVVTGNATLNIKAEELMKLSFNVTYIPLYSARIKTHKQLIQKGYASTLAYNQGANAIESRYYGEHLKGVVERLGNVEKTYTYKLAFLSQIPVVGTRFDNNYYISNVSWELFPTYIKCTVGLSKNFNRLSQYVGINSQKRMWEISERQSVIRESAYPLYIVVSENQYTSDISNVGKITQPAKLLFKTDYFAEPISAAKVATYDIKGNAIADNILMPVVASALGNSMLFTYTFEDNYSAGQKVEYISDEDEEISGADISGYWGNYVQYTDFYGRFYLLKTQYEISNLSVSSELGLSLPQLPANISDSSEVFYTHKCVYRKDNREIPQITHQITVVTDDESIIIGSALCRNSSAVNANPKGFFIYYFDHELNLFESKIDTSAPLDMRAISGENISDNSINIPKPNKDCKSWAIVTASATNTIDIEEEDGTQSTQTIQEGGEILLAQNNPVFNGNNKTIYFTLKRKIND